MCELGIPQKVQRYDEGTGFIIGNYFGDGEAPTVVDRLMDEVLRITVLVAPRSEGLPVSLT